MSARNLHTAGEGASDTPERDLWCAVLLQWLADCITEPSAASHSVGAARLECRRSRMWLASSWFEDVCGFAGIDASAARAYFRRTIAAHEAALAISRGGGLAAADPPGGPRDGTRRGGVGYGTHQPPLDSRSKIGAENRPKKISEKKSAVKSRYTPVEFDRRKLPHSKELIEKRLGRPLQLPKEPKTDGRRKPHTPEMKARLSAAMKATRAKQYWSSKKKQVRDAGGVGHSVGATGSGRFIPAAPHQNLRDGNGSPSRGAADVSRPGHPVGGRTSVEGVLGAAVSTGGGWPPPSAAGEILTPTHPAATPTAREMRPHSAIETTNPQRKIPR